MVNKIGFVATLDRVGKSNKKKESVNCGVTSKEGINSHAKILEEIHDTYIKKNADYGDSFSITVDRWGFIPAIARIEEKVRRITNIVKGNKMNYEEESLRDNLLDIANYCIMTIMAIDKDKDK